MPVRFNEDMIRPVLIAYFRMGRLYSKIVTPDKATQLDHLKQSLNAYKVCRSIVMQESQLAEITQSKTVCEFTLLLRSHSRSREVVQ
jgi:hypothetical protein